MWRFLIFVIGLISLAAQDVGTTQAQAPPQKQRLTALPAVSDDTLIVGATTLKLGTSKDDVVRLLSAQYDLKSEFETPKKEMYDTIDVWAGKQDLVARVHFDAKGDLEWAAKFWTPDTSRHYSDGEIGRAIFALWGTLPTGVGCRMIARQSHFLDSQPPFKQNGDVQRDAHIECGHKRITFSTTSLKGDDSLSITEEIDSKSILDRP